MARLAFTAVGAGVGFYLGGPAGAAFGAQAGGLIGGALFPPSTDDIVQQGARVGNQATTASAYGIMRPWGYGIYVVSGNIIDGSNRRIIKHQNKSSSGGKGGSSQTVVEKWETAERDLAIGLGEGPISGILKIYANEQLIWDQTPGSKVRSPEWLDIQIYLGTETQLADPTLESIHGVGNVPPYRGEAYVMFRKFQLEQFNNSEPSFRFLVVKNGSGSTNETELDPGLVFTAGNLLHDRNTGLMHFFAGKSQAAGTIPDQVGVIYDADSQEIVGVYSWPNNITQLDEATGANLFSIPTVIAGEEVSLGANSHAVLHTEISDVAQFSVFDTSGTFIGNVAPNVPASNNTQSVVADETLGLLYQKAIDAPGFLTFLKVFSFVISDGTLALTEQNVGIPIAERDGTNEWTWNSDPSYPEGTDRAGTLLFHATDEVDNKDYLCLIISSQRAVVDQLVEITDFGSSNVAKIVWDSIQELFWVIGESDTGAGFTRLKAFNTSLTVVHNVDLNLTLYNDPDYITYDASTRAIWCFTVSGATLYEFNTIDLAIANTYTGWSNDSNPADSNMQYHPSTRTLWRKGDDKIFLLQLDRLSSTVTYLDDVLDDLCDRAGMSASQYRTDDCSAITVESYAIDVGGSYRSKIVPLLTAYLVYGIDKEDYIDFVPYSTSIVDLIPERDLGASSSGEALPLVDVERRYEDELPYKVEVSYYNADTEYEQGSQSATRQANINFKGKQSFAFPLVLTDDEAAAFVDVVLHLSNVARLGYRLNLMPKWRYLSGADVIQFVDDNGLKHTARILRKEFVDGIVRVEAERFDPSVLISFLSGGSAPGRTTVVENTPLVLAHYLDSPLLRERDDNASHYMAATAYASSWRGGSIYKSTDGTTWSLAESVFSRSSVGRVIETMPAPENHHLWDATTSVTVEMVSGELESSPASTVVQGANLVLIGRHGRWEACAFANKTLVSGKKYSVNTWLRGRLGTEHAMGDHQAGDAFIVVSEDDLDIIQDTLANLQSERIYRAVSFGADLYGYHTRDTRFINTGVCLEPYAPDPFAASKDIITKDIELTWTERSRFPAPNAWSGTDSEVSAQFSVDVKDAAGSVVGSYGTTGTTLTYARASQVADGFSSIISESGSFEIFQISDRVGRGYKASVSGFEIGPLVPAFQRFAINNLNATVYYPLNDETTGNGSAMANAVTGANDGTYYDAGVSARTSSLITAANADFSCELDGNAGVQSGSTGTAIASTHVATVAWLHRFDEAISGAQTLARLDLNTALWNLRTAVSGAGIFTVTGITHDAFGSAIASATVTATTTLANGTTYMLAGSIGPNGVKVYVDGARQDVASAVTSVGANQGTEIKLRYGYRFSQSPAVNKHRAQGLCAWSRQLADAEVSALNIRRTRA